MPPDLSCQVRVCPFLNWLTSDLPMGEIAPLQGPITNLVLVVTEMSRINHGLPIKAPLPVFFPDETFQHLKLEVVAPVRPLHTGKVQDEPILINPPLDIDLGVAQDLYLLQAAELVLDDV